MTIRDEIEEVLKVTFKPLEQCGFVIKYLDSKWGSKDSVDLNVSHPSHRSVVLCYTAAHSVEVAQLIKPEQVVEQYIDEVINYTVHY